MKRRIKFMSSETDELARRAVAIAIERHRRLGQSIATMRDGKVVVIPPEEIPPLDEALWREWQPRPHEPID